MASKSGEVDTGEGATTEPETMEFMDLSTDPWSLTPRKRKAETLATPDTTANEDEEEEEKVDSCTSDQEWDVDSFKDEDFHSSDLSDDEEWRRYVRQCYKSEGFDVPLECFPTGIRHFSGFYPVDLDDYFKEHLTGREYMERMLKVVIEKYNEDKKKNLVLDHIVRAVIKMAIGIKAYITFMAKESPEGELVEYQGKADCKVWQRNIHPLLCRPASEQRKRD